MNDVHVLTSWIDVVVVVVILVSTVIGLFRGFIKESISLLTWVAAIWVAIAFAERLAPHLPQGLEAVNFTIGGMDFAFGNLRIGVAFASLVVLTLIAGAGVSAGLQYLKRVSSLSLADRFLGVGFGLARGIVLVTALVLGAGMTEFPRTPWWEQAKTVQPFQHVAMLILDYLPDHLAERFDFSLN